MHCKLYGNHSSVLHYLGCGAVKGNKQKPISEIFQNSASEMFYKDEVAYVPRSWHQLTLLFPSNQFLHLENPPLEFPTHKLYGEKQEKKHC